MDFDKASTLQSLLSQLHSSDLALDSDGPAGTPASTDDDIFVTSVLEAQSLLQRHRGPLYARYRARLLDFIIDPENKVYGDSSTYHNLVMALFRMEDYLAAIKVCRYALNIYPYNLDLLGDLIRACGDCGQWEMGDSYLKLVCEKIPQKLWNWRLFLYATDYMENKVQAFPGDETIYQEAYKLAESYKQTLPWDEHSYNRIAKLKLLHNERQDAIDFLRNAILSPRSDSSSGGTRLVAATCCITLLDILDDSTDYGLIIEICDAGLRNTTQEQPSANIGYFIYRKALAQDAQILQDLEQRRGSQPNVNAIKDVLETYRTAYRLNQDRDYGRTIELRYAVLQAMVPNAEPLRRYPLYEEGSASSPRDPN